MIRYVIHTESTDDDKHCTVSDRFRDNTRTNVIRGYSSIEKYCHNTNNITHQTQAESILGGRNKKKKRAKHINNNIHNKYSCIKNYPKNV